MNALISWCMCLCGGVYIRKCVDNWCFSYLITFTTVFSMYTWTRRVFRHLPWSTLERYVETNFPVFSLAVLSILVGVPFCCADHYACCGGILEWVFQFVYTICSSCYVNTCMKMNCSVIIFILWFLTINDHIFVLVFGKVIF